MIANVYSSFINNTPNWEQPKYPSIGGCIFIEWNTTQQEKEMNYNVDEP